MLDEAPPMAEVFGELRRFHVYDHDEEEWVISGCDFDGACVVRHRYESPDDLTVFVSPRSLVRGRDNMTLVWEDDLAESAQWQRATTVGLDVAERAAEPVRDELADRLDREPSSIKVSAVLEPDRVRYFTVDDPGGGDR